MATRILVVNDTEDILGVSRDTCKNSQRSRSDRLAERM